jgi:hypothetical protein
VSSVYDLADELTESEALDLMHHLRRRHGWQGSLWLEADLSDMWEEIRRPDFGEVGEGYGPEIAKPWHEVRDNVLAGRGYTRWFSEYLAEKGNEYLADWILDLNPDGTEQHP